MAPPPNINEIKLTDIDFETVKACTDKHVVKKYIKLLEDDGSYFLDLLKACKNKLLELSPKDYYLLYPLQASDEDVQDATRDLLDWETSVKETDQALLRSKKDKIWEDFSHAELPIRGQEPTVARPNLTAAKEQAALTDKRAKSKADQFARDKSNMKDYYRAWDKVDVDSLEAELDEEERQADEARKKHFEDLKDQQNEAQSTTPIEVGKLPEGVPEAHRKYMADTEKEKGNESFYSKDYEEADAYYTRSLHYRADDPPTWANRALVRLKLDRPGDALQYCDHALALNPRYMKALHRKGKSLFELRRYEESVRFLQLAMAESPGNAQINGDLMVARRKLRSDGPGVDEPPRRPDDPPSCRIEEIPDDTATEQAPPPKSGFTRVQIEEDSDSESDGGLTAQNPTSTAAPQAATNKNTFRKVIIEEVSGSEDEEETGKGVGPRMEQSPALGISEPALAEPPSQTSEQVLRDSNSQEHHAQCLGASVPPQDSTPMCFEEMD